jgi:hypothetical protein
MRSTWLPTVLGLLARGFAGSEIVSCHRQPVDRRIDVE